MIREQLEIALNAIAMEELLTQLLAVSTNVSTHCNKLEDVQKVADMLVLVDECELQTLLPNVTRVVKALSRVVVKCVARIAADAPNIAASMALDDNLLPILRVMRALVDRLTRQAPLDDKELVRWLPFVLTACYFVHEAKLPGADLMKSFVVADEVVDLAMLLTKAQARESVVAQYVAQMVALCAQDVDKKEWTAATCVNKQVMLRIVEQVSFPHFGGDVLGRVLALTFPLVDDVVDSTQFIGARLLLHIVKNVTPTELRWYSDVLLEVLYTAIVSRKPETLDVLLECLVESLDKVSLSTEVKHYDRFIPRLLSDTSLCTDVALRAVLVRHLRPLVIRMGAPHSLNIIRYLQPLLKVLIAGFESINAALLMETLETLRATVLAAWPRIAPHTEHILVGVLRAVAVCELFDEGADFALTSKQQEQLLSQCEDILDLLHQVNAAEFIVSDMLAIVSAQSSKLSPFCDRVRAKWATK